MRSPRLNLTECYRTLWASLIDASFIPLNRIIFYVLFLFYIIYSLKLDLVNDVCLASDLNLDISRFKTPNRKAVTFHISNFEPNIVFCDYIKVGVLYRDANGEEIGERIVRLTDYAIKPNVFEIEIEAGEEHVKALEAIYNNPYIYKFIPQSLKYRCDTREYHTWTSSKYTSLHAISVAQDGSFLAPSRGRRYEAKIAKISAYGSLLWQKGLDGHLIITRIVESRDGSIIFAGSSGRRDINGLPDDGTRGGGVVTYDKIDIFIGKMDRNGNIAWNKKYGGNKEDRLLDIKSTSDGGFIVTGHTSSYYELDSLFLMKLDRNGEQEWFKNFESEYSGWKKATTVLQAPDGGYFFAGYIKDHRFKMVLIKTDLNGNLQWRKVIPDIESPVEAVQNRYGDFIVLGRDWSCCNSPNSVLKVDRHGNRIWKKNIQIGFVNGIDITSNDEYIIAFENTETPDRRAEIIKLSKNGKKLWQRIWADEDKSTGLMDVKYLNDGSLLGLMYNGSWRKIHLIKFDPFGGHPNFY